MSHDKIRAAARQRMTETGEPYTAARRAAVRGHQAAAGQDPPADQDRPGGTGYPLTMSGEIRDWLADLRTRDPAAAARVGNALATLMEEGARLGEPMVASTADSWPWALLAALDLAYQELLDRWQVVRLGEADAISLVRDLRRLATELESARAKLADARHGALIRGGQQAAGQPCWPTFRSISTVRSASLAATASALSTGGPPPASPAGPELAIASRTRRLPLAAT